MDRLRHSLFIGLFAVGTSLHGAEAPSQTELLERLDNIVRQHKELTREVDRLRELLGNKHVLEEVLPKAAPQGLEEWARMKVEQGNKAYMVKQYGEAKSAYQEAWEASPFNSATNFNLGLAYYRLGNLPMAKKMLKYALEADPTITGADQIRHFVADEPIGGRDDGKEDLLKPVRTNLVNLRKEAESYGHSKTLTRSERIRHVIRALKQIETLSAEYPELQREFMREVAQLYTQMDLYDRAINAYSAYEKAMEGRELPDGYHSEVLQVEEKHKALAQILKDYRGNVAEGRIRKGLERDREELAIFASQMDEFVEKLQPEDPDFTKITKRLGDFRWGKLPGKHVLVLTRYEDVIYSSLPGTLPIDRYQDNQGRQFLRNLTLLADKMTLKETEFFEVNLSVNGRLIPYVVLYTYVPKHEAFVVVRLPKEELI